MRQAFLFALPATALFLMAAAPEANGTEQQKGAKSDDPGQQVICEKQEVVGSRLAVKRVCKTRAQWAEDRLQDRKEVERVQTQRGMPSE